MPLVGFGTYGLKENARSVASAALSVGYRLLDTAFGESEQSFGGFRSC